MAARLHPRRGRALSRATFRTTVVPAGNATGAEVPAEVVDALGEGKRPKVGITINGHRWRSRVASIGGRFLVGISAANRAAASIAEGNEIEVTLEPQIQRREAERPVTRGPDRSAPPVASRGSAPTHGETLRRVVGQRPVAGAGLFPDAATSPAAHRHRTCTSGSWIRRWTREVPACCQRRRSRRPSASERRQPHGRPTRSGVQAHQRLFDRRILGDQPSHAPTMVPAHRVQQRVVGDVRDMQRRAQALASRIEALDDRLPTGPQCVATARRDDEGGQEAQVRAFGRPAQVGVPVEPRRRWSAVSSITETAAQLVPVRSAPVS